jgi:hypothetical protein
MLFTPEMTFVLDKQSGPKYIASQSSTIMDKTIHVVYLVTQKSEEIPKIFSVTKVDDRISQPMTLSVIR